ncbi:sialin-like [Planococcus citri]|uniref:sialin-like n=1 Tax=Planococcus citri TaxID=170843 RepID=UPI0031F8250A
MLETLSQKCSIPKRYIISLMVFIGYSNITFLHTNLSMAVVEMTAIRNISNHDGSYEMRAEFNWTSQETGQILSSYSYGRLFSPLGGLLAGKLGGSTIYSIGTFVMTIITFLTPVLLSDSVTLFVVVYIIFGAFEAFLIAGVPQIVSRWSPPNERARFISFGEIGFYFGAVVSFVISGWILKNFRWEVLFYSSGLVSFVWFWIWFIVVKNDPSQDKNVSEIELKYIQETLNNGTYIEEKLVYPWKKIMVSTSLWVAALAEFSIVCGYIFTAVFLPQFIKDTEHIDIAQIGITSTLPQICAMISMPLSGIIGDFVRSRNWMSITNVHRLFAGVTLFSAAICYALVSVWSNFALDIVAISSFQFFSTFMLVDITVLFLDISPKYTAFLMSIVNMFAISAGIIVPCAVGFIVTSHSLSEWNTFFMIFSSMYVLAALLYLQFVSGDKPSWTDYNGDTESDR